MGLRLAHKCAPGFPIPTVPHRWRCVASCQRLPAAFCSCFGFCFCYALAMLLLCFVARHALPANCNCPGSIVVVCRLLQLCNVRLRVVCNNKDDKFLVICNFNARSRSCRAMEAGSWAWLIRITGWLDAVVGG